jgi:hypothetical protein
MVEGNGNAVAALVSRTMGSIEGLPEAEALSIVRRALADAAKRIEKAARAAAPAETPQPSPSRSAIRRRDTLETRRNDVANGAEGGQPAAAPELTMSETQAQRVLARSVSNPPAVLDANSVHTLTMGKVRVDSSAAAPLSRFYAENSSARAGFWQFIQRLKSGNEAGLAAVRGMEGRYRASVGKFNFFVDKSNGGDVIRKGH